MGKRVASRESRRALQANVFSILLLLGSWGVGNEVALGSETDTNAGNNLHIYNPPRLVARHRGADDDACGSDRRISRDLRYVGLAHNR